MATDNYVPQFQRIDYKDVETLRLSLTHLSHPSFRFRVSRTPRLALPQVFTVSVHCQENFPFRKSTSDIDVGLVSPHLAPT